MLLCGGAAGVPSSCLLLSSKVKLRRDSSISSPISRKSHLEKSSSEISPAEWVPITLTILSADCLSASSSSDGFRCISNLCILSESIHCPSPPARMLNTFFNFPSKLLSFQFFTAETKLPNSTDSLSSLTGRLRATFSKNQSLEKGASLKTEVWIIPLSSGLSPW